MRRSGITIGCMSWGKWGKGLSTLEQTDLIEFCVSNGNTTFDHADIYGDYSTVAGFGKALAESSINRGDIHLVTKCGIQLTDGSRSNRVKHYNYSKDYIIWSVEQSLKHLQTDYIDTLLLHRPSPLMHPQEIATAIIQLKEQEKIKHFGVSNFLPSQVALLQKEIAVEVNQVEFSLTQPDPMFNGVLDQCIQENMQPMSWSPLGSVFKQDSAQTHRIKPYLEVIAEQHQVPEATILLAWILKHPSGVLPVIGTTSKQRIKDANKALEIDLTLEEWFSLLEASQGKEVP